MNDDENKVVLFMDNEERPFAELSTPVQFELDTQKLTDGEHLLRIVSRSSRGREGVREVRFFVRNGPAITISGLKENDVIDGVLPIMINAYDKGNQQKFIIEGSETPQSVPSWLWLLIILFSGWAAYYAITYFHS